jgi:protein involved in polysaccharide export with SLBB domain
MIEHPFVDSSELKDKTTDELQNIIGDLAKKLNYMYRLNNQQMITQINMMLYTYRHEYNLRMEEQFRAESGDDEDKIDIQ